MSTARKEDPDGSVNPLFSRLSEDFINALCVAITTYKIVVFKFLRCRVNYTI